ncbi:MAG TPA: DedA family protein [Kouleothrix sp.]|uniref:DedA family protein n=1 Tax=Kouleothrix sp. TaxID=2779161 RepID=UPI002BFE925A|nr:DedA family protein [Kouleothrix sp.]HRC76899.1 DedA family protein [Kouleothrix sp.]
MNLSDLNDLLLSAVVTYGATALGLVLLLAAVGLPLPSTLCVLAGGAFVQQGVLDPYSTFVLALVGAVIGDMLSYGIGWVLHRPIQRRYGQSAAWLRAEAYFARRAAIAVFLTRCVLTPIALPINLVAGGSGYSVGRFALYDAAGELAWLAGYGTLGYVFGSQWEYVSDVVSNASGVLVGLLIAGVGGFALLRWQRGAAASAPSPVPMPEPGLAARLPEE